MRRIKGSESVAPLWFPAFDDTLVVRAEIPQGEQAWVPLCEHRGFAHGPCSIEYTKQGRGIMARVDPKEAVR